MRSSSKKLINADTSGVTSSPTRFVVSCNAFAPTDARKPVSFASNGRAVRISTVAPIPPDAMLALPVLKTETERTLSDARSAKSNARELGVPPPPGIDAAGMVLPFKVTMLKPGPRPRTVILLPSPLLLSIETPVILCNDSAKFVSGNLPISSADIASTTPRESRLMPIDS